MTLSAGDASAIRVTLELASVTTVVLLLIGTPISWWLAFGSSRWKGAVATCVALPLVLPPTVIGFYLLLLLGPNGFVGRITNAVGVGNLPFTFPGLVLASTVYSLPFVVQPLQNAFEGVGRRPLEAEATLGAGPLDRIRTVAFPLARRGYLTATIVGFAHTMGEFGVVLMIGGNIPGKTRVLSVAIYDHVEALEYDQAHTLAAVMLAFSFVVLFALYTLRAKPSES
ncbi:MAG TPA: molybdate ABC transporter permease subunit [Polyangiaceae bacterium]|nr:molybdate ABC transporter permease subunit [Polyangiaceae bacterium]